MLYGGLHYIEVHDIEVPVYHFNLFIVLNTGKDGRDGRDGSGIKVGLFKLQTLLSLFAWKVQKFKLIDPGSCMSPVKWSLLCECIKLPKRGFFGHLGLSLSRERRIKYKIIFKKLIIKIVKCSCVTTNFYGHCNLIVCKNKTWLKTNTNYGLIIEIWNTTLK